MEFIHTSSPGVGAAAMAERIAAALKKGKVLWLLCGGSNIPLSVEAMDAIRVAVSAEELQNLTVAMTDERYGPLGHPDSNWKQLEDAGLNISGVTAIPILVGKPLQETVDSYAAKLQVVLEDKPLVVAQFGIGADGHIAGMLPHSSAALSQDFIYGYEAAPYTRITLTVPALKTISVAYAIVFGASKKAAIERLKDEDVSIEEMPCQILKQIPGAYFYTDQLEG